MLNFASVRFIHVLLKSEKSISLDNLLYLITSSSLENNKSVILSKSDILLRFSASQSNPSKERAAVLLEYGPKKQTRFQSPSTTSEKSTLLSFNLICI